MDTYKLSDDFCTDHVIMCESEMETTSMDTARDLTLAYWFDFYDKYHYRFARSKSCDNTFLSHGEYEEGSNGSGFLREYYGDGVMNILLSRSFNATFSLKGYNCAE